MVGDPSGVGSSGVGSAVAGSSWVAVDVASLTGVLVASISVGITVTKLYSVAVAVGPSSSVGVMAMVGTSVATRDVGVGSTGSRVGVSWGSGRFSPSSVGEGKSVGSCTTVWVGVGGPDEVAVRVVVGKDSSVGRACGVAVLVGVLLTTAVRVLVGLGSSPLVGVGDKGSCTVGTTETRGGVDGSGCGRGVGVDTTLVAVAGTLVGSGVWVGRSTIAAVGLAVGGDVASNVGSGEAVAGNPCVAVAVGCGVGCAVDSVVGSMVGSTVAVDVLLLGVAVAALAVGSAG